MENRGVQSWTARVGQGGEQHGGQHASERDRAPPLIRVAEQQMTGHRHARVDRCEHEAGEEASMHVRPERRHRRHPPEGARRTASPLHVVQPLEDEREEHVGEHVRAGVRVAAENQVGDDGEQERRRHARTHAEHAPEDEGRHECVDEHAGGLVERQAAQAHEECAGRLEEPVIGDPLVTRGSEREYLVAGNGAGGEDVPAGGQVPADSRVAELPSGPQKHDRRVDQEHEERERWREPTPDGRGRRARRRGAPPLPSQDGLPLRAHPHRLPRHPITRGAERPSYRSALAAPPDAPRRKKIAFIRSSYASSHPGTTRSSAMH